MATWNDDTLGAFGSASQVPTNEWFDVNTQTGAWGTPPPTIASDAGVSPVRSYGEVPGQEAFFQRTFSPPDPGHQPLDPTVGAFASKPLGPQPAMQRVQRLDEMGALTPKPSVWETIARGIGMASPEGRAMLQASDAQQQQQLQNRLVARRQMLAEEQNDRAEIRDDFNTLLKLSEVKSKALRNLYTDRWVADMQARGKSLPADFVEAFKKTGIDEGQQMAKLLEPLLTESGLDPAVATQLLAEGRSPKDIMDAMELAQKQKKLRLEQQEITGLDASRQQMFGTVGDVSGVTQPAAPGAPGAPQAATGAPRTSQMAAAPAEIEAYIAEAHRLYPQVRPELIRAVMLQESSFKPNVTGSAGEIGLMQLKPATAKELGVDPRDPLQNVRGGTKYLAQQLTRYGGNEARALAAYNRGPGAVPTEGPIPEKGLRYAQDVLGHTTRSAPAQRPDTSMLVAGPDAPAPTQPALPAASPQDQAQLTRLNQQIAAMDQFLQANIGRGSERTRAAVTQVERLRDNLTKERDQLTEPARAGVRAQSETRARTTVEREVRGDTTLAEAFKGDTPSLYDTQTGQQLDARMKVKEYEARPPGSSRMLSSAQREQMENLNASVPIIAQLQTHIDKIYGPGGVFARMTSDDLRLVNTIDPSKAGNLWAQMTQRYPELVQAQRFIEANAGALARSLAGEKGAMAEGDVARARAMLPSLITSLKAWPISQIGVKLPDTRATALGTMNSVVDMINARARTLLGNEQYTHPKLHRYQTAEEAQQAGGSGGPHLERPRPQDIAPEGTPAAGLNPNWGAPGSSPPAAPGATPTAQAAPAPTPTPTPTPPKGTTSGQRALKAMSPAQLRSLPERLVQTVLENPGMAAGLSPEQNGALMERLNQFEQQGAQRSRASR